MKHKILTKTNISAICILSLLIQAPVYAAGPGGSPPGGGSSSNISWSGATTYTSSTSTSGKTYTSTSADENAVLINTTGTVKLTNPTVTKSGGTSASDNYSFYGINSAIMCKGGGTTTITGGTIKTTAAGANAVFSYGANSGQTNATGDGTTVNISNTKITTTAQGSGGIMTTYGGTTNATNLTVTTSGGSSAPIRTDRGGGWVNVTGGTYTSNGQGSPAIYSTADVNVTGATLISNASEGTCIEGTGSIELTNCNLTATNNTLNGNATFYDTIMIYQSMSGDASSGTSEFTMTGGKLISKKGHTFHVTNTTATINLNNVNITNSSDNVLISVCDDGWSGGSNTATLNAANQTLTGTVLVGSDSKLTMNLTGASTFSGKTSGKITNAKGNTVSTSIGTLNVTLESGSTWKLTGDSYVTSISGKGSINYNGYTLYVNGTAHTESNPVSGVTTSTNDTGASDTTKTDTTTITKLGAATLSYASAIYNGKKRTPSVTVTATVNGTKKTLTKGTDYTVTYKNNKNVGTASVVIAGKGSYTGTITKTFKIRPIGTAMTALAAGSKCFTVKWKKQAAKMSTSVITGYQVQYSTSSSFKSGNKLVTVAGYGRLTRKVTGLTSGKTYYVRVRTYKTVNGTKYYSAYSAARKVKVK